MKALTKDEAIITSKQFRKEADDLLQRMKEHGKAILASHSMDAREGDSERYNDPREVIAQHTLSYRALEDCIMRQGMALKYIGAPNPYPNSKDPSNTKIEPTADGLKM